MFQKQKFQEWKGCVVGYLLNPNIKFKAIFGIKRIQGLKLIDNKKMLIDFPVTICWEWTCNTPIRI